MGLAAGLALGLAIVALLEYRDTTFATDGDLVLSLAVPVLAVVPTMQTERERRRGRRIRRVGLGHSGCRRSRRRRAHRLEDAADRDAGALMYDAFFGLRERPVRISRPIPATWC
jgi:hypothetical protein